MSLSLLTVVLQVPGITVAEPAVAEEAPEPVVTQSEALAAARSSGKPVEVAGLRGESREVMANPDGTLTEIRYLQPRWTRKGGTWASVDTRLEKRADGSVAPVALPLDLVISGGDGPFVRLSRLGRELSLSWPGRLPEPELDGDTAVFASVLPDIDLRVRAEPDGFSHLLVIKTAEAARNPALAKLRLGLRTSRLSVRQDADGLLQAVDSASGTGVFEAPAPMMWDSGHPAPEAAARSTDESEPGVGGQDPEQGPGEGSAVAPVKVELSSGELALSPDQELLTSPETQFPVYVDPSWTSRSADGAWAMVSSGYPDQSYYKFSGTEGVGYCSVSLDFNCNKTQIKRLFYRMPLSGVAGRYVTKAEFIAYQTHSYDCSLDSSIQLYRTSALTSSATWDNTAGNWGDFLASRHVSYCSRTPVEFASATLTSHVKSAVDNGYQTITFGLRAYREDSMNWWKRFAKDAYLRITYNTPPDNPLKSKLSSNPGGPCEWDAARPVVKSAPTIKAYLYDKDTEDAAKVTAQFQMWWDDGTGWGLRKDVSVGPKASGSAFETQIPATIPEGKLIGWRVRAYDGKQYSAWSNAGDAKMCEFVLDTTKPAAPQVTSTDYPDDDADHGGVGQYGQFTFIASSPDVVKYQYALNGSAKQGTFVQAPSVGAPVTVNIMPTSEGPNTLSVIAYDAAGNDPSEAASYTFRAGPGTAPKARFTLDEPAGSTSLQAVTRDGEPSISAQPQGGITLGEDGQIGSAMRLNGSTGYAATSGSVLDTTRSFTVSAWARLDNKTNTAVVAAQDGTRGSAFALYYSPAYDRWVFNMQDPDTDSPTLIRTISAAPPTIGQWAYLVGVYDHVTDKIHLYVNGALQATTDQPNTYDADGPLQIGRFKWKGSYGSEYHLPGTLDDLRLYDRVVTGVEVLEAYQKAPVVVGRWKLNSDSLDDSGHGHTLTLGGGAAIDPFAGYVGDPMGGLALGAGGGYASTSGPVVATNESFTIAGWVSTLMRPQANATVFSQAGSRNSGFTLRYATSVANGVGGWQIAMPASDTDGATVHTAEHAGFIDGQVWHHVAIVYDAPNAEMRLYVDGDLQQTEPVSWKSGITVFNATGGLQFGRTKKQGAWGEYFDGVIDDVWAFKGTATREQLQILTNGFEELPTESVP